MIQKSSVNKYQRSTEVELWPDCQAGALTFRTAKHGRRMKQHRKSTHCPRLE